MGEIFAFYSLSALILLCAVLVVFARNPVASAIALVIKLFLLAGMYGLIGADFLAAIQVIVYAGAIMVLFTFVIMLLNVPPDHRSRWDRAPIELVMVALSIVAMMGIGIYLATGYFSDDSVAALTRAATDAQGGNTLVVGRALFAKYLWPFELASLLILMAIVASIVIARKYQSEANSDGAS